MRRACLFLLLVIGWSMLLMMQDRDGRNIWSGRGAQAQTYCSIFNGNEFACVTDERCGWDSETCECYEAGCDPNLRALCLATPSCEWDEEVCECFCPEPCGTYTTQVSSTYEYQECRDGKLYDCGDTCVTTYTYDECTDEQINESTNCETTCVWDFLSCC